jgi:hypothetical protein
MPHKKEMRSVIGLIMHRWGQASLSLAMCLHRFWNA